MGSAISSTPATPTSRWGRGSSCGIEAEVGSEDGEGNVTILDRRAPWDVDLVGPEWTRKPVAGLRYDPDARQWTLYWVDPAQRFRLYDRVPPSAGIADLLDVIESDPLTVFWG